MEPIQAERLVKMNLDKLDRSRLEELKVRLVAMDYNQAVYLFTKLKTPTTATILSVIVGDLAIDRFYIGDWILGILKRVTCGGCFIWWIADWFLIGSATRSNNTKKILSLLPYVSEPYSKPVNESASEPPYEEIQNTPEN